MELPRRDLKSPLRVLCLISDKTESRGLPGLRTKLNSFCIFFGTNGRAMSNIYTVFIEQ